MNVENINRVIQALKDDREKPVNHFKMGDFAIIIDYSKRPDDVTGYQVCNTAMCIAGWANTIRMIDENSPALLSHSYFNLAGDSHDAAEWLDIDGDSSRHLFFMARTECCDGQDALEAFDAADRDARYNAAIAVLEHLRDTGKADWQRALRAHYLDDIADLIDDQDEDEDY